MDIALRIGLFVCVVALAASTVWLGMIDKNGGAAISATLCIGLCIFLFLARFKRFKGLGFEGELWEQEMEEAVELQRDLRNLSERVGEIVFWQLGPGSRMGGGDPRKILAIIERTESNLEALNVDRQKIEELKRPWHKCIMRDLANPITVRVRDIVREGSKVIDAEIAALGSPTPAEKMPEQRALIEKRRAMNAVASQLNDLIWRDDYENVPRLLREAIDESPWLTNKDRENLYSEFTERFQDIDHYAREGSVQHPKVLEF